MPQVLRLTICAVSLVLISCACSDEQPDVHQFVLAIDRTGLAQIESWSAEVATQTQAALEAAVADGVDHVDLIAVGSNTQQVATIAEADLNDIEGNTEAKRDAARQTLLDNIASAAAQAAAQPVDTAGTDVFAALDQAASLCQAPEVTECSMLLISDLEDQRVTGAPSAEEAITSLAPLMPDLTGVSVQVSGLGASGVDAATVQKVKAVWTELLQQAGAVDIRVARSL